MALSGFKIKNMEGSNGDQFCFILTFPIRKWKIMRNPDPDQIFIHSFIHFIHPDDQYSLIQDMSTYIKFIDNTLITT
jgi:hypothetical protein